MRLHSFITLGSLLIAATTLGCAASSNDSAVSESNQTNASLQGVILLQAQELSSVHLGPDGRGTSQRMGFDFQDGPRIVNARSERLRSPTTCTTNDGTTHAGSYIGDGLTFFDETMGKEVGAPVPLLPAPEGLSLTEEQRTEITGNVGRYVFVRERHDFFGCGAAHPSYGVNAFVWDLWKRGKADPFTVPPAALERAKAMLAGRGFANGDVKLAELIPVFDAQGHLSIDYRFEKDASHAEADHEGSDYSVSAIVHSSEIGAELPGELAALRDPPTIVQIFLRENPGVGTNNPIKGWSISDDNQTMHGPMCRSNTLHGRQIDKGTCVQDSDDDGASWYRCDADGLGNEAWSNSSGPGDAKCESTIALCTSKTLGRKVPHGTCVQDINDDKTYFCGGGSATDWVKPQMNSCWSTFQLCDSGTLGRKVAEGSCVQDSQDRAWYRCGGNGPADWSDLPKGPDASCRTKFPYAP